MITAQLNLRPRVLWNLAFDWNEVYWLVIITKAFGLKLTINKQRSGCK